jgi:hypothetical protein
MGNWRRVLIDGTCAPADVLKLRTMVGGDNGTEPLCGDASSLCGLPNWAASRIHAVGNCSERDFGLQDIANHLVNLRDAAPSLDIKVHCGGDYESDECVATVVVNAEGVRCLAPEISTIPPLTSDMLQGRMSSLLLRG